MAKKKATNNPGRKKRKVRQRKVKRYQKLREDLQLAGEIPTAPEGAVRNEVVDHASQGEQLITDIVIRAAKEDWSTPSEIKPIVVRELAKVVVHPDSKPIERVAASNALGKLDQIQYERDNPEEAGKAKGGTKVGVQVNVDQLNWQALVDGACDERDHIQEQIEAVQALPSNGMATNGQNGHHGENPC